MNAIAEATERLVTQLTLTAASADDDDDDHIVSPTTTTAINSRQERDATLQNADDDDGDSTRMHQNASNNASVEGEKSTRWASSSELVTLQSAFLNGKYRLTVVYYSP